MNNLTVVVRDQKGMPISGAGVSFAPLNLPLPGAAPVTFPLIAGGLTGVDGRFTRQFFLEGNSTWLYTARAEAQGYEPTGKEISISPGSSSSVELRLTASALPINVIATGLPALISVGNPPPIRLRNLPYLYYAYIETTLVSGGNTQTIETPISPDGSCAIDLAERLLIDPLPVLVASSETPLPDTALCRDYVVSCNYVNDGQSRNVGTWTTRALLIDCADVSQAFGQWLPNNTLSAQRGTYADFMLLLPAGTYQIARATELGALFQISATSDGKTPLRVRMPPVPFNARKLTMYAAQAGVKKSNDLTIMLR